MLILSQDGTVLINTNYAKFIFVHNDTVFATYDSEADCIGKYRDENRAKEILTQIMSAAQRGQNVFYMPEDES